MENKPKHTPGPWKWQNDWKKQSYGPHGLRSMDDLISTNGEVLKWGDTGEEGIYCLNEADAALIAAAPEMLEALEYLVAIYSAIFTSTGILNAQKAIAKAKGEVSQNDE